MVYLFYICPEDGDLFLIVILKIFYLIVAFVETQNKQKIHQKITIELAKYHYS